MFAHPSLEPVVTGLDGTLEACVELAADELFPFRHVGKRRLIAFPLESHVLGQRVRQPPSPARNDPIPMLAMADTGKFS